MKETYASFSNAFYILAGVVLASQGVVWIGILVAFLGLASGLFHATLDPKAQSADEIMMYAVFSSIPMLAFSDGEWGDVAMGFALMFWLSLAAIHREEYVDSFVITPALVLVGCLVAATQSGGLMAAGLVGVYAISAVLRQIGAYYEDMIGYEFTYDLLHSSWHLLTALAIYWQTMLTLP